VNTPIINELSKIESRIIEYYKQLNNNNNKKSTCLFAKQLNSGSMKLYKEYNEHKTYSDKPPTYVVKISGIWETEYEIGITYKVIESFPTMF